MELQIRNISKTYANGVLGSNRSFGKLRAGPCTPRSHSRRASGRDPDPPSPGALRRMLEQHRREDAPLATTLDLVRELQAVTPDAFQYLLHDLFEVNTFWALATDQVTAAQTEDGNWQVTLDVQARKVVADEAGVETEAPMNEPVQIGVFAPAAEGEGLGEPLYVQMHRIRAGEQTITVTVPSEPAHAGVDPYHLLIDLEMEDNIEAVQIER